MKPEIRALYQDLILDHGKNPRNFKALEDFTHVLEGYNPLCGDKLKLYLRVKDNKIEEASFNGQGCAISMASASMMSQAIKNKTITEAKEIYQLFHRFVTESSNDKDCEEKLGKLRVLAGVKEFPSRVKCATLAWHTLKNALEGKIDKASSE